ncbi:PucR family transcriptional regulator [Streptomyces sp. NPDC051554]|uniref:PucR family transcriptional regulator n=1 Tax=Streptomyces sp. NPDC051554 TaxID=3365656 RepID=UPI00379C3399
MASASATASLRDVVETLGTTVLQVTHAPQGLDTEVSGVAIQDPTEGVAGVDGDILLGVGATSDEQVLALLDAAGRQGAAAVVVKHTVASMPVASASIALLRLERSASWTQVMSLIRSFLASHEVDRLMGEPAAEEDLFATANAVAGLIDAPVVIEDRAARVLAYSSGQEHADEVRKATILARRDPAEYIRMHRERNVFEELYASDEPLVLEPMGEERMPRVALALRAGDEIVGSMWAATPRPLSEVQLRAYAQAAGTVALHVLRARAVEDVTSRMRADLLGQVLTGGTGSREAAGRLGLPQQAYRLVAVGHSAETAPSAEIDDLVATLRLYLSAVRGRCVVRRMGEGVYAAVAVSGRVDGADEQAALQRTLTDFVRGRPASRPAVYGAVGREARSVTGLQASRSDCDQVMRVLRAGLAEGPVAAREDVQMAALLLRMSDTQALGEDQLSGPAALLLEYDRKHGTDLVGTVETQFAVLGDVASAAERLQVHPNTFRYRLRRVTAISGLDPFDAEALMTAVLELRLQRLGRIGQQRSPDVGRGRGGDRDRPVLG